jgi:uncharacterized cysteine cluster protein YcgN (CxxCxxCC family)
MTNFWEQIPPEEMSRSQWESLCDNCGRCCLQKFLKPTTGKIYYTWVACFLLDLETCRCSQYDLRQRLVPDCLELTPARVPKLRWLPRTCAYRLIAEGKKLPPWHPLISGNSDSVHQAGISIRRKAISETLVPPDQVDNYRVRERFW